MNQKNFLITFFYIFYNLNFILSQRINDQKLVISDCFTASDVSGCLNTNCQKKVCKIDNYCCVMNWDQLCVRNANYYCNSANKNLTRNDLTPKMNNLLNNSTLNKTDETTNNPLVNKTTELPLVNKTTELPLVNETTDKPFNPLLNKTDNNNENKNNENKKNSGNKNILDNKIFILTSIIIIFIIN